MSIANQSQPTTKTNMRHSGAFYLLLILFGTVLHSVYTQDPPYKPPIRPGFPPGPFGDLGSMGEPYGGEAPPYDSGPPRLPAGGTYGDSTCNCLRWTNFISADNPGGQGDYETLGPPDERGNPGTIHHVRPDICTIPVRLECRTVKTKMPWYLAYEKITYECNPYEGFVCENKKQLYSKCHDYEVRVLCFFAGADYDCPCLYWTQWYDSDDPPDGGDVELIGRTLPKYICQGGYEPVDVQCQTVQGVDVYHAGNKKVQCDLQGLSCYNNDQGKNCRCNDYKVRFLCPKFPANYPIPHYDDHHPYGPNATYRGHAPGGYGAPGDGYLAPGGGPYDGAGGMGYGPPGGYGGEGEYKGEPSYGGGDKYEPPPEYSPPPRPGYEPGIDMRIGEYKPPAGYGGGERHNASGTSYPSAVVGGDYSKVGNGGYENGSPNKSYPSSAGYGSMAPGGYAPARYSEHPKEYPPVYGSPSEYGPSYGGGSPPYGGSPSYSGPPPEYGGGSPPAEYGGSAPGGYGGGHGGYDNGGSYPGSKGSAYSVGGPPYPGDRCADCVCNSTHCYNATYAYQQQPMRMGGYDKRAEPTPALLEIAVSTSSPENDKSTEKEKTE